ncbi:hypothetical protein K9M18_06470 [Candidatus Woesearchaeota archaeon]|nr:hypothetical protein [Candidatus Woesearchaeota archaeon]
MKKLGLDIGTNSIGWALIENDIENNTGSILGLGSRIVPMDNLGDYEKGNYETKAKKRTKDRGARRLLQRYKLRRTRLIRVFKILGWMPESFPENFKGIEKHNINDYLPFSEETLNQAKMVFKPKDDSRIYNDWIIYFLRNKALNEKVTLYELARILYHFNQRRGFKSGRKDLKEITEINEVKYPIYNDWVEVVKVESVIELNSEKGFTYFELLLSNLENSYNVKIKRKTKPDWEGQEREFAIKSKTTKDLNITYSISEIDPIKWENRKKAHEKAVIQSNLFVGQYYLNRLLEDRNYRTKDRIIDRKFYKEELSAIWTKQLEFNDDLKDNSKLSLIATKLYEHNIDKQKEIKANDLLHVFMNDIIYYQRDLKSQKHLISFCQYETMVDNRGKEFNLRVTPKSSPFFQEFRIWQTIHNLKILQKEKVENGKLIFDVDVTDDYLDNSKKEKLFELFDSRELVSHDAILSLLGFKKDQKEFFEGKETKTYLFKLNFPTSKDFFGNVTKAFFRKVFKKHDFEIEGEKFLSNENLFYRLWHVFYSINDIESISETLSKKPFNFSLELAKHISKLLEFKSEYASYSAKAIKKFLPLLRAGKYWEIDKIDSKTLERIQHILNAEDLDGLNNKTRQEIHERDFKSVNDFVGLSTHLAAYVIYGRHSEKLVVEKYSEFSQVNIKELIPYNSLRNPVVEKMVRETLNLTKEIWKLHGQPDEIHIELGRDLKKNSNERKEISSQHTKNEIERKKIIEILKELNGANSESPSDIEKFQLWKDTGGTIAKERFDELFKKEGIVKDKLVEYKKNYFLPVSNEPSKSDIEKYKLWVDANHLSPYTARPIPLGKLFTEAYQIEHIIPRSRFFDDSFGNKTICESEVNALKDNMLGMEFIEACAGRVVNLSDGSQVKILSVEEYKLHTNNQFKGKKKRYLTLIDVPEEFISRQLNDTRYISRTIGDLMHPFAKRDNGLIFTNGTITSELKGSWGLHKKWKELLKPRFERLAKITGETLIEWDDNTKDFHFKKDYKRVDHRHHAMDAIIIACTSRSHIQYLNSLNALNKLPKTSDEWRKYSILLNREKQLLNKETGVKEFEKPWSSFTMDVFDALQKIVVSHKPSKPIVTKAINKYIKWEKDENNIWKKVSKRQEDPASERSWKAVKISMFKGAAGAVKLREYKSYSLKDAIKLQIDFLKSSSKKGIGKIQFEKLIFKNTITSAIDLENQTKMLIFYDRVISEINDLILSNSFNEEQIGLILKKKPLLDEKGNKITKLSVLTYENYAAKRVSLNEGFSEKNISKIPYSEHSALALILKDHLNEYKENAFKGEGLEILARKNNGKPITKVTNTDGPALNKISLNGKLLEVDGGANQYFEIKINSTTMERSYRTIPLLDAIDRLSKRKPINDLEEGYEYIILSPNDYVYVPDCDSEGKVIEDISRIDWVNPSQKMVQKIYLLRSFSKTQAFFIPAFIAKSLEENGIELGSNNKSESVWDINGWKQTINKRIKEQKLSNQMIKGICIKLKVDRLGNVNPY